MLIRHRITLAVFMIGAVVLLLLLVDRAATARSLLFARVHARAEALAEEAAFLSASALKVGRFEGLKPSLRAFRDLPGVARLTVSDERGAVLFEDPPSRRRGERRLGGVEWVSTIADGDQVLGRVYIRMSSRALETALSEIVWRGIAMSLAGLAALAAASWLIGASIGRRLESLADALDQVDAEREVALPAVPPGTEMGRLVAAFRRLRERLLKEESRRLGEESLREDLTNMLVHDLKHPLSVFRLAVGLIEESSGPEGDARKTAVSLARRGMSRLEAMVEEILQIARLRQGAMPVARERARLEELLAGALEENRDLLEASGRSAAVEFPADAAKAVVSADSALTRRILGNLILNAIEHSPEGATVRFGARMGRGGRAELFVSNPAPGLDAERLDRAFDKYRSYEEGAANAGLGLAFCRLAAEAQGGRMTGRLREDGTAEFVFSLPAARAHEVAPA